MLTGWCFRKASGGESLSFLCLPSCFQSSIPWNRRMLVWGNTHRGPDKCAPMCIVNGDSIVSLCDVASWTLDPWILSGSFIQSSWVRDSVVLWTRGTVQGGFAGLLILKRIRLAFIFHFPSFLFFLPTFDSPAYILLADPLPLRMWTLYQGFNSWWLTPALCWFGESVTIVRVNYERAP